jgi:hypothetical protein
MSPAARHMAEVGAALFGIAAGYVGSRDLLDWFSYGEYYPRRIGDVAVEIIGTASTSPLLNIPALPAFLVPALICLWLAREPKPSLTDTFR